MFHRDPLLTAAALLALSQALSHGDTGRLVRRLIGVLMVSEGSSCADVAGWLHVDARTVQRWVHAACLRGLQGMAEAFHGGRPRALTAPQLASLQRDLREAPACAGYADARWSGKRLALHLRGRYGVSMSVRNCQRLIAGSRG